MPLSATLDDLLAVAIATFLGAAVGAEREWRRHAGGLRSSALVAAASCMFARMAVAHGGSNPGAGFGAIVSGIGFLGGGVILRHDNQVRRLATAATFWALAAIGMAAAMEDYAQALALTLIVFFAHVGLRALSTWIEKRAPPEDNNPR